LEAHRVEDDLRRRGVDAGDLDRGGAGDRLVLHQEREVERDVADREGAWPLVHPLGAGGGERSGCASFGGGWQGGSAPAAGAERAWRRCSRVMAAGVSSCSPPLASPNARRAYKASPRGSLSHAAIGAKTCSCALFETNRSAWAIARSFSPTQSSRRAGDRTAR